MYIRFPVFAAVHCFNQRNVRHTTMWAKFTAKVAMSVLTVCRRVRARIPPSLIELIRVIHHQFIDVKFEIGLRELNFVSVFTSFALACDKFAKEDGIRPSFLLHGHSFLKLKVFFVFRRG